jgi:endonuclease/exonuclease/phosphatase family metal-dependent hydrolase
MPTRLRIATFNLENFDDGPNLEPPLAERIAVMRPQLVRVDADVLCLQEVHGQESGAPPRTLAALDALLAGTPYASFQRVTTLTRSPPVQPYDKRNLVVLSRFPVMGTPRQLMNQLAPAPAYRPVTANPPVAAARDLEWERPILYVTLGVNGRPLHVVNLHLKSKNPSPIAGQQIDSYTWRTASGWAEGAFISGMKRVGQALETRMLVDSIFDTSPAGEAPWIAVCGDFNATPEEVPVVAIRGTVEDTGNAALGARVLVPCENTVPADRRYSLIHQGRGEMIDHVLVSRALLAFYRGTEVHNEVLPDESGAFRTDVKFPESDHAPVVAEFVVP